MAENSIVTTNAGEMIDPAKVELIKGIVARNCTNQEFGLLMYLSQKYGLDPLARQIWAVKYGENPAQIFVGRDGFLAIAHQSKQFDGMESGTSGEGDNIIGWAKVYRRDMSHPFTVEVRLKEYQRKYSEKTPKDQRIWENKPHTMIQKVAEAQALRRAFSISGVNSPEEIDEGPREMRECEPVVMNPTVVSTQYDSSEDVKVGAAVKKKPEQPPVSSETAQKMEKAGFTASEERKLQPGIPDGVPVTRVGDVPNSSKGTVVQHEGKWITREEFERIQQMKAGVSNA